MALAYQILGFNPHHGLLEKMTDTPWPGIERAAEAKWPSVCDRGATTRTPFRREDWDAVWGSKCKCGGSPTMKENILMCAYLVRLNVHWFSPREGRDPHRDLVHERKAALPSTPQLPAQTLTHFRRRSNRSSVPIRHRIKQSLSHRQSRDCATRLRQLVGEFQTRPTGQNHVRANGYDLRHHMLADHGYTLCTCDVEGAQGILWREGHDANSGCCER